MLELNNGNANYYKCILKSAAVDGDFILQLACGGRIIQNFLDGKQYVFAEAPRPDPSNANSVIIFPYTVSERGDVLLTIVDALGREVYTQNKQIQVIGKNHFILEPHTLNDGAYTFEITYKGVTNSVVRGRFVVLQ